MRSPSTSTWLGLLLATVVLGCTDAVTSSTGDSTPPLSTVPDFVAGVDHIYHNQGISPVGPLDQYELLITIPPGTRSNAGLILGRSTSVFRQTTGAPVPSARGSIGLHDTLEIWVESGPVYGSAQAPPGAPAYAARQVVIRQ